MTSTEFNTLKLGDKVKSPIGGEFTVAEIISLKPRKVKLSPNHVTLNEARAKDWQVVNR